MKSSTYKKEMLTTFGSQPSETSFNLSASIAVVRVIPLGSGTVHILYQFTFIIKMSQNFRNKYSCKKFRYILNDCCSCYKIYLNFSHFINNNHIKYIWIFDKNTSFQKLKQKFDNIKEYKQRRWLEFFANMKSSLLTIQWFSYDFTNHNNRWGPYKIKTSTNKLQIDQWTTR